MSLFLALDDGAHLAQLLTDGASVAELRIDDGVSILFFCILLDVFRRLVRKGAPGNGRTSKPDAGLAADAPVRIHTQGLLSPSPSPPEQDAGAPRDDQRRTGTGQRRLDRVSSGLDIVRIDDLDVVDSQGVGEF